MISPHHHLERRAALLLGLKSEVSAPKILMKDEWIPGPIEPVLEKNTVHLWRVFLKKFAGLYDQYWLWLSTDEQERARRFHFEKDRFQFVVSHGILRELLHRYTKQSQSDVQFELNSYNKPFLIQEKENEPLLFNLAHSGDMALVGFVLGREIGVDVEHLRPGFASQQIAEHFFSPCEILMLDRFPKEKQEEEFFICWTCKESYVKAKGGGLSLPLNEFDISSAIEEGKSIIFDTSNGFTKWAVRRLDPGDGYAAAFTVSGSFCRFACFEYQSPHIER